MSVYRAGEGTQTIVMLPGYGTFSPIVDFKPLADKLAENYQVIVIEPLGYGMSDDTDSPRMSENIVGEIRTALAKLNVAPPYIFMPHSISGVYALEYVKEYPEEVKAIVGIDTSVPNQGRLEETQQLPESTYLINRIEDETGITRLVLNLGFPYLEDMKASNSYTEDQLKAVKAICARRSVSKAQINEMNLLHDNFEKLYDSTLPKELPVLFFISRDSCKSYEEDSLGVSWDGLHKELITNPDIQKLSYLEGGHYLHWTNVDEMAKQTMEFIGN